MERMWKADKDDWIILSCHSALTLTFARRVRGAGLRWGIFTFSFAFPLPLPFPFPFPLPSPCFTQFKNFPGWLAWPGAWLLCGCWFFGLCLVCLLSVFFFCSVLLRCDLLSKKVPGRAPYSQLIIIRNWT